MGRVVDLNTDKNVALSFWDALNCKCLELDDASAIVGLVEAALHVGMGVGLLKLAAGRLPQSKNLTNFFRGPVLRQTAFTRGLFIGSGLIALAARQLYIVYNEGISAPSANKLKIWNGKSFCKRASQTIKKKWEGVIRELSILLVWVTISGVLGRYNFSRLSTLSSGALGLVVGFVTGIKIIGVMLPAVACLASSENRKIS